MPPLTRSVRRILVSDYRNTVGCYVQRRYFTSAILTAMFQVGRFVGGHQLDDADDKGDRSDAEGRWGSSGDVAVA